MALDGHSMGHHQSSESLSSESLVAFARLFQSSPIGQRLLICMKQVRLNQAALARSPKRMEALLHPATYIIVLLLPRGRVL